MMDSLEERTRLKERRIEEMYKVSEEEEDGLLNYSEKEQFFEMLNVFKNESSGNSKEEPVPVKSTQKENFKIQLPSSSGNKDNNNLPEVSVQEQILSINGTIMRQILEAKWEKILLEEGSLEEVLDWNSKSDLEIFYTEDLEHFGDDWLISFEEVDNDDSFEF